MGRDTRRASSSNKETLTKNEREKQSNPTKKNNKKNNKQIQKGEKQTARRKTGQAQDEPAGRSMRVRAGVLDKQEVHTICLNNNGTSSVSSEINQPTQQMDLELPQSDIQAPTDIAINKPVQQKNEAKCKKGKSKKASQKIVSKNSDAQSATMEIQKQESSILNPEVQGLNTNGNSHHHEEQQKQSKENGKINLSQDGNKTNGNGHIKETRNLPQIKGIKESNFHLYLNSANGVHTNGNGNSKNGTNGNTSNGGSSNFLGKEDQFKDFSIIVGSFQKQHSVFFGSTFTQEAKMRGFNLEIVYDDKEFISKINSFDIAWIVDSSEFNKKHEQSYIDQMKTFFSAKKSIYIHAGANSCFSRTNLILTNFFDNMSLQGKLKPKEKFISPNDQFTTNVPYTFNHQHNLAFGISSLKLVSDQSTVLQKHQDFSNFLISQNCQPLVLYSEENDNHGRVILDCGFLSYDIKNWSSDHFQNYLSNSTVWLTGIPN